MSDPVRAPKPEPPDPPRPGASPGFGPGASSSGAHATPSGLTPALRLVALREHSLLALFELSHELSVSLDTEALAEIALLNLMGQVGTGQAALWLMEEREEHRLTLAGTHGVPRVEAMVLGTTIEGSLARWTVQSSMPVLVEDAADRLDAATATHANKLGLHVLAPVFAGSQVVGCAALGRRGTGAAYSAYDLEVLRTSLGMLGAAIANARLFRRVRDQYEQLARADAARRELDRMKSEFLQNVNHELRTPLSVIAGATECLMSETEMDPRRLRLVRAVHEQAGRLHNMMQSLLEYSSSMDDTDDRRASFDTRALVRDYANACRGRVEGGGHVLVVSADDTIPHAVGNASRVPDILDRLINNAVKFSPPGSRIELRAAPAEPSHVRLSVRDEGPGVAPEKRAAIFDSFAQGDGSTTRSTGGLGLGLATARRWAELMGGVLELDDSKGPGATFSLLLPRA